MVAMIQSLEEMESFAASFLDTQCKGFPLGPGKEQREGQGALIVCLHGDLGSGKTTFVKGIGKALGVKETLASPTFVVEKVYKLSLGPFEHLVHIDAYRLSGGDELLHLGFKEVMENSRNLICIEWAENIAEILPEEHVTLIFKFIDENTRVIECNI